MSADLYSHAQRLNIALTELLASTVQIDVLIRAGIAIETSTYRDYFERSAICIGDLAGLQEEIVRVWQDQTEKGKEN